MINTEDQLDVLTFSADGELTFIAWVQEEEQYQSAEVKKIGLERETEQPRFTVRLLTS